jgi:hypothetical protein
MLESITHYIKSQKETMLLLACKSVTREVFQLDKSPLNLYVLENLGTVNDYGDEFECKLGHTNR